MKSRESVSHKMYIILLSLFALTITACAPLFSPTTPIGDGQETSVADGAAASTEESAAVTRYETLTLQDGTEITYAVVLPAGFDESKEYPILLALPPGGQTRSMVDAGLAFWADGAIANGWVVLSPVAPNGTLFFHGSEESIPEFLEQTRAHYKPEGGKYHIGGISNGGISTFRIAGGNPDLIQSLIALPGFAQSDEDKANLARLTDIPIAMFVGENDTGWAASMQETEDAINAFGGTVSLEIVPGEGHIIRSLEDGIKLYELLESFRP